MAVYLVKNEALGARGVGEILIEAQSEAEVELTEDQALLLGDLDGVTVSEPAKPAKGKPAAEPAKD